jgi:hypothetical protein
MNCGRSFYLIFELLFSLQIKFVLFVFFKAFYMQKFLGSNERSFLDQNLRNFRTLFSHRLKDPHIGDKIEVAWKGKFRLESTDVYQGKAWWLAEIVDKHTAQGRYKIHYPGWESRWDEWVPRSRFRWAVDPNVIASIFPSDRVELWCCGSNVPGAWLEARVSRIRDGLYCINKVSSGGPIWVERSKLRLAKLKVSDQMNSARITSLDLDATDDEDENDDSVQRRQLRIPRTYADPPLQRSNGNCSIM